jgi:hypothetical protein
MMLTADKKGRPCKKHLRAARHGNAGRHYASQPNMKGYIL